MRNHLRDIALEAEALVQKQNVRVLDIGCNDGTLLRSYSSAAEKYGIDPSDVAQEIGDGMTVIQDIFPSKELTERLNSSQCDVITSIAMFYDLEDPIAFTRGVKALLDPDGLWIFEMSYMPLMLKLNSYDTICHEHLEYYSLAVIDYILNKAGMKVFNATMNDINGGSIRCYATHAENFNFKSDEFRDNLQRIHQEEFDLELDTDKPYKNFQDRINFHRDELLTLVKKLKKDGKVLHLYGASTKGNTILQWCGLDSRLIDCAAERNPDKYGARTLGTDIPIVSEAESRAMKPDYYLVLPWHFKTEFLEREKQTLALGTKFIFPLPSIEIY